MWEICKNTADAAAEFDRTMQFIAATIQAIKDLDAKDGGFKVVSGIQAKVRRAAALQQQQQRNSRSSSAEAGRGDARVRAGGGSKSSGTEARGSESSYQKTGVRGGGV